MRLNKPVGRLELGRSRDDLWRVVNEIFAYCQTEQFEVAVRMEESCREPADALKRHNAKTKMILAEVRSFRPKDQLYHVARSTRIRA